MYEVYEKTIYNICKIVHTMCILYTVLFLKFKQKKNMTKHFFYSFYFRTQKCPFSGIKQFFLLNFFSVSAFKTIDTQMLF